MENRTMWKKLAFVSAFVMSLSGAAFASEISGDYIETRSADVYTGQCFANGEMNLVGNQALLAWHVKNGTWKGVELGGLVVAGAVRANATLGDPYANPYPARSVVLVDERATPRQREALVNFAMAMGGELLANVVEVETAPMAMAVERQGTHATRAFFRASGLATIETRSIGDKDHLCGNEYTFYPPLTETVHAMPAVALRDEYRGPALGVSWSSQEKRSAYVGGFER
jgi:hypothetical protein